MKFVSVSIAFMFGLTMLTIGLYTNQMAVLLDLLRSFVPILP